MWDNKLKYSYTYDTLIYDIETPSQNDQFPNIQNEMAFVASIQFSHNKKLHYWTLNIYRGCFTEIDNVDHQYFTSSSQLCQQFILYLNCLEWYTLVIGHNASQDFASNNKLDYNKFYGFDLPWLIHQSGYHNLSPQNRKVMNDHFVTYQIHELYNCLFIDSLILLTSQIKSSADMKQKRENLSLNAYCKLYNCPQKLDIDFAEVNKLLIHEYNNPQYHADMDKFV
jgi:hypothetical protein